MYKPIIIANKNHMRYIYLLAFIVSIVTVPTLAAAQGQFDPSSNTVQSNSIQQAISGQQSSGQAQLSLWFSQTSGQVSTFQSNQQLVQSYTVDPNIAASQGYYPGGLPMNPILSVQTAENQYGNTIALPGSNNSSATVCRNITIKDIASLSDFIRCTISNSLIPLAVAMGLLFLAWGITMLVLNAGNEEAREKGKQIMIWGLISFFVLAAVWALVGILLNTFQLNNKTKAPIPCFQTGTC